MKNLQMPEDNMSVTKLLSSSDLIIIARLRDAIEAEGKRIQDVSNVDITLDTVDLPDEGGWKRKAPGEYSHIVVTFKDGSELKRRYKPEGNILYHEE